MADSLDPTRLHSRPEEDKLQLLADEEGPGCCHPSRPDLINQTASLLSGSALLSTKQPTQKVTWKGLISMLLALPWCVSALVL